MVKKATSDLERRLQGINQQILDETKKKPLDKEILSILDRQRQILIDLLKSSGIKINGKETKYIDEILKKGLNDKLPIETTPIETTQKETTQNQDNMDAFFKTGGIIGTGIKQTKKRRVRGKNTLDTVYLPPNIGQPEEDYYGDGFNEGLNDTTEKNDPCRFKLI